jgi:hypothetical protein
MNNYAGLEFLNCYLVLVSLSKSLQKVSAKNWWSQLNCRNQLSAAIIVQLSSVTQLMISAIFINQSSIITSIPPQDSQEA